jgi:AraC family transcriptional regulator, melibiose operon regulatory protein
MILVSASANMAKPLPKSKVSESRRSDLTSANDVHAYGMYAWHGIKRSSGGTHSHNDIELNFVVRGNLRYFIEGRDVDVRQGHLAVFWAGPPHRWAFDQTGTEFVWVTLPLAWVLEWNLRDEFVKRLFSGALTILKGDTSDDVIVPRWAVDFASGSSARVTAALLEIEARLRRIDLATGSRQSVRSRKSDQTGNHVEKLARWIGEHFRDDVGVNEAAQAVGLHPSYATTLFRQTCGMPLLDYLLRLRVSHAQRLLVTTNWKMTRIGQESGFSAMSRFYDAFKRIAGQTPKNYRKQFGAS